MNLYRVHAYQPGFESDHARVGADTARDWIWPYAYDEEALRNQTAQPAFDPDLWLYAFLGDVLVGYSCSSVTPPHEDEPATAVLDLPRVLPGHPEAAQLLMAEMIKTLRRKGITRVTSRVTTMCPQGIRLAGHAGFAIRDWGYKMYYAYETVSGKLDDDDVSAEMIDPTRDLDACAAIASRWYKRPPDWCRRHLEAWHDAGIIAHVGVRKQGRLVAACMAAANEIRPSTAALYYIVAPDKPQLRALVLRAVNACVDAGATDLIADLIHEHRAFEPVYRNLGFRKVADWARCERDLPPQMDGKHRDREEAD